MTYSKDELHTLRNDIPINVLIREVLDLPSKESEGYLRFLCPLCREFNTATNPQTNLARCFRCHENFNPIDLVMVVEGYSFKQAVEYLLRLDRRRAAQRHDRQIPADPQQR
jgi:DNA primase